MPMRIDGLAEQIKTATDRSGLTVLFAGGSRDGMTLAASQLAGALKHELYQIDLSVIVGKYTRETEKHLEGLLAAAESSSIVLFFDEADSLFGKRSEVKDAHDRFANGAGDYLLTRIERFAGIAIIATGPKKHLDDAFVRRMRYVVEFPPPSPDERKDAWRRRTT